MRYTFPPYGPTALAFVSLNARFFTPLGSVQNDKKTATLLNGRQPNLLSEN